MRDLFLRSDTRETMWAGYHAAGLTVEISAAEAEGIDTHDVTEGEGDEAVTRHYVPRMSDHGWSLDDGIPIALDGEPSDLWHANLRILSGDVEAIRSALEGEGVEIVSPANPQRTWA